MKSSKLEFGISASRWFDTEEGAWAVSLFTPASYEPVGIEQEFILQRNDKVE